MKHARPARLLALPLALSLLLSPAARALTVEQAGELLQDYYIDEVPEDVLSQPTIQTMLEDKMAEEMLDGRIKAGSRVEVGAGQKELTFTVRAARKKKKAAVLA